MHRNTAKECGEFFSTKIADDFVLATGETKTVREFAELTFRNLGIELEWKGKGENEKGVIKSIDLEKAKKAYKLFSKQKILS